LNKPGQTLFNSSFTDISAQGWKQFIDSEERRRGIKSNPATYDDRTSFRHDPLRQEAQYDAWQSLEGYAKRETLEGIRK
jgi:hypothetical protein